MIEKISLMGEQMEAYGPVQLDCVNEYWQVVDENDHVVATFLTKKEAEEYIEENE